MTFDRTYVDEDYIVCKGCNSIVSLKENKSEYRANNTSHKEIIAYRVDGDTRKKGIVSEGEKCDYALYLVNEKTLYLIELKGTDYPKAISQIISSIDKLIVRPRVVDIEELHARIVLSKMRVPNIIPNNEKILLKKLKELNNTFKKETHFKRETQKLEENI